MMNRISPTAGALAAFVLFAISSLAFIRRVQSVRSPVRDRGRVWPPAPAPARLAYVQTIRSPADLGLKASAWSRMNAWVTGRAGAGQTLAKPFGLAVDEGSNLCLTDMDAGRVCYL